MRLIGTLEQEDKARKFTAYLKKKGIDVNCEIVFDPQTHHTRYHLWIREEDQIPSALSDFQKFLSEPTASEFDVALPPPMPLGVPDSAPRETTQSRERHKKAPLTHFFIALCVFVFFLQSVQEQKIVFSHPMTGNILMTPVEESFFFDVPQNVDQIAQALDSSSVQTTAQAELAEEKALVALPYWHGAYDWVLNLLKGTPSPPSGPLFYKVRQGEIWRLFTPVLLHGGFLHILFNMLWLWVLGIPVEQRIGKFRTLGLTLLLGCGSNVSQYLMGGPFFIGYSGIVVGLAGFIWIREKIAPWEGYPLQKSTFSFLTLFVIGVFVLQCIAFFLDAFTSLSFNPNIANTGHIGGGLIGFLLGRSSLFARGSK